VIVFIDEADDVLADRSTNAWNKSVTNDLLTAMDGAKGKVPDIVWVAATNMPDTLDSAVVRGGRFTEKILFGLPDEATLATYITSWREKSRSAFDTALTPIALAGLIGQVSIANVQAILQTAVNHMIGHGHDLVRAEHVIAARDEVLAGS
jgi:transitional endoplasmic reticulum ATPase